MFSAYSTFKSAIRELRQDLPSLLKTNYMLLIGLVIADCYASLGRIDSQEIGFTYLFGFIGALLLGIMLTVRVVQAKISTKGYRKIGWYGISWTWCENRLLLSCLLQGFVLAALLIPVLFFGVWIAKIFSFDSMSALNDFSKYLLLIGGGVFLFAFGIFYFMRTFFNIILAPAMYPKPLRSSFKLTQHHKFYILKVLFICLLTLVPIFILLGLIGSIIFFLIGGISLEYLINILFVPISIILSLLSTYLICGIFKNISASDPEMQKQVREGFVGESE